MSLEALWAELNNPRNRPTSQVVVEAILLCIRERGIGAFQEAANLERLRRCDRAARAELQRRIDKLQAKGQLR